MKTFNIDGCEINVKRLYLPVEFKVQCSCGEIQEINIDRHCLSYPSIGEYEPFYWCCSDCSKEHEFKVKLNASLDVEGCIIVEEKS